MTNYQSPFLKKGNLAVYLLTFTYFLLSLVGIYHHELWLDEAHHWLLARDSTSILNFIENSRLEGHPLIWDFLLYGISRMTSNPFWMQFLHIYISSAAVWLFIKKAPFSWLFKILFIFGYFMLFEYNLISRNYILGILFLFIACSLYVNVQRNFIWICLMLAFAANVHLVMAVPACAFMLLLILGELNQKTLWEKEKLIGLSVFIMGFVMLAVQIFLTNSSWFFNSIHEETFLEKISPGFISFFKGVATIPNFTTINFWNTNWILDENRSLGKILGLLVYGLPLLIIRSRKIIVFVYVALLGMQIFFYITQRSAVRFDGITYIILILGLWMDRIKSNTESNLMEKCILYPILLIQFFSGIMAYSTDIRFPFTSGKRASLYLNETHPNANVVTLTCDGALISPYLKKKVYSLCAGAYQSYCVWDYQECQKRFSPEETMQMLAEYSMGQDDVFFVSSNPKYEILLHENAGLNAKIKIVLEKTFEKSIIRNSELSVYKVSHLGN